MLNLYNASEQSETAVRGKQKVTAEEKLALRRAALWAARQVNAQQSFDESFGFPEVRPLDIPVSNQSTESFESRFLDAILRVDQHLFNPSEKELLGLIKNLRQQKLVLSLSDLLSDDLDEVSPTEKKDILGWVYAPPVINGVRLDSDKPVLIRDPRTKQLRWFCHLFSFANCCRPFGIDYEQFRTDILQVRSVRQLILDLGLAVESELPPLVTKKFYADYLGIDGLFELVFGNIPKTYQFPGM